MSSKLAAAALTLTAVAALCACSGSSGSDRDKSAVATSGHYPITVTNCGRELTIKKKPERVVIVGNEANPLLHAVEALDSVVARVADLPKGVYAADFEKQLEKLPKVESKTNATGGSLVSTEVLLSKEPDLIIGADRLVDMAAMANAGVQVYVPPAFCAAEDGKMPAASYDQVYAQVAEYGKIFDESKRADEITSALKQQVAGLASGQAKGTAAALFLATDGGVVYAYGKPSMVTPIFAAAGMTNVYADEVQRVFEVSAEDLLGKDPERIVLLYTQGDPAAIIGQFSSSARNADLKAVKNKQVYALPFAYTDPPSPLSVQGASRLAEAMGS